MKLDELMACLVEFRELSAAQRSPNPRARYLAAPSIQHLVLVHVFDGLKRRRY